MKLPAAIAITLVALLVLGLTTACGGNGQSVGQQDRVNLCVTNMYEGMTSEGMSKNVRELISPSELRAGLRSFCGAMSEAGLLDKTGDTSNGKGFVALLHKKPEIYRPICLTTAYAARGNFPREAAKYLSLADWRRYGANVCRFAPFYVRSNGHFDARLLVRQHPEVVAPFGVIGFLVEYDKDPAAYGMSRSRFKAKALAFVTEGLRTGAFVYQGGSSFKTVRGPKYRALVHKYFG